MMPRQSKLMPGKFPGMPRSAYASAYMYTKSSDIPFKNTWGVKKVLGQEEAALIGDRVTCNKNV